MRMESRGDPEADRGAKQETNDDMRRRNDEVN